MDKWEAVVKLVELDDLGTDSLRLLNEMFLEKWLWQFFMELDTSLHKVLHKVMTYTLSSRLLMVVP